MDGQDNGERLSCGFALGDEDCAGDEVGGGGSSTFPVRVEVLSLSRSGGWRSREPFLSGVRFVGS